MPNVDKKITEEQYSLARFLYDEAFSQDKPAKSILNANALEMYTLLQLTWRILDNDKATEDFREYLKWDIIDLCKRIDGKKGNYTNDSDA